MSTAVVKAAKLKPEIRLAQAVSQFEADLSSEQKAAFRAHRVQTCKSPPDIHDVMRLTAEFDRHLSRQRRAGRCFGPRLTNFLQAIQQFAALGDIIVGGSQNIIACGVWTLVRMTLLSIVRISSCLEELTTFLMVVGRSAPRYERLALLYPQSKALRAYLSEYYIVVAGLCHKLWTVKSESMHRQLFAFLGGFDLKTYKSRLEEWANLIKEETSILKVEEHTSRLRALSKFSEAESRRQRLKTNLRILNFCSTYDHTATWKEIRKGGTTTLFDSMPQYREWKGRPGSCTLVSMGSLGSGKSVWLANIVDDLNLEVQDANKVPVTFFFCRHDIAESLEAQTVVCSLARQLLRLVSDLSVVEELVDEAIRVPGFQTVLAMLKRALPPDFTSYFVLDGLDECSDHERRWLTQQLRVLQDTFSLRICVSFRVDAGNVSRLDAEKLAEHSTMQIPRENPDIDEFIDAELERCLESGKLAIGDPTLILEIREALLQGSQGMFLWVALQIGSLCVAKSDEAVRQALADLPKDLPGTFSRIIQRSGELGKSHQTQIFELVITARRPLTTEELREALSVIPGDTTWNPARLINNIYLALACCGSLISVDEESLTVRLIHHSVKQFLIHLPDEFPFLPHINNLSAEEAMARIVVTYLNYGVFTSQVSTTVVPQIASEAIPSKIVRSIDSAVSIQSLALKFLKARAQSTGSFDLSKVLLNEQSKSASENPFRFYSYAKSYWTHHLSSVPEDPALLPLQLEILDQGVPGLGVRDPGAVRMLLLATLRGHDPIVRHLIERGITLEGRCQFGRTSLSCAARVGHASIVELLLQSSADIGSRCSSGLTPLSWAARAGRKAVVPLLLQKGADLEAKCNFGRTPLSWTACTRFGCPPEPGTDYAGVTRMLLENGADLESRSKIGCTPLWYTARDGHQAVLQVLLEEGADIEAKNILGQTPLFSAASEGHAATVQLLLEKGAEIEAKDSGGDTPLLCAVALNRVCIAGLLVAKGADLDARNRSGHTPLTKAALLGNKAMVEILQPQCKRQMLERADL